MVQNSYLHTLRFLGGKIAHRPENRPLRDKAGQSKLSLATARGALELESLTKWLQSDCRVSTLNVEVSY